MLSTFISFLEKKVVLSGWGKVMGVSWGEVEVMCINSRVIIKLNSRILLWIMNLVGSYLNRWSILGLFFVFGSMTFRSLYNCTLKTGTRLQIVFFSCRNSSTEVGIKGRKSDIFLFPWRQGLSVRLAQHGGDGSHASSGFFLEIYLFFSSTIQNPPSHCASNFLSQCVWNWR